MQTKQIWVEKAPLDSISQIAKQIVEGLNNKPFTLWMQGEMGAGKTTLSSEIMHCLGLDARVPVTSPTYSYLNEYDLGDKMIAHMDLYRASLGFRPENLGLLDHQPFFGKIIEWPENISDVDELFPSHIIKIESKEKNWREYSFYAVEG